MTNKLKRDQLPARKAKNWRASFQEEEKHTLNLKVPKIILEKPTYLALTGENENRVRLYLGLDTEKNNGKYTLCVFAVSAFLLGSGDVYADYETPVFKLSPQNEDYSNNLSEVLESIKLYRQWRNGELDPDEPGADVRQYIYPNAYLMTKFELHEIFVTQNMDEALIDFGISKTMSAMIRPKPPKKSNVLLKSAGIVEDGDDDDDDSFDDMLPCPPACDPRSVFNP